MLRPSIMRPTRPIITPPFDARLRDEHAAYPRDTAARQLQPDAAASAAQADIHGELVTTSRRAAQQCKHRKQAAASALVRVNKTRLSLHISWYCWRLGRPPAKGGIAASLPPGLFDITKKNQLLLFTVFLFFLPFRPFSMKYVQTLCGTQFITMQCNMYS